MSQKIEITEDMVERARWWFWEIFGATAKGVAGGVIGAGIVYLVRHI